MKRIISLIGLLAIQSQQVSAQPSAYLDQAKLAAIADRVVVLASEESMELSAQETEFFDRMERVHKADSEGKLSLKDQMAMRVIDLFTPEPSRTGAGICLGFAITPTVILTAKHCSLGFKSSSSPGYVLRYDLRMSEWQISRFSQPIITMGPMPATTHPIGFLTTGPDIALIKIDRSQPLNIFKSRYDFQVEPPDDSAQCYAFDWYNLPSGLESLNTASPELMHAVTGVRDPSDETFFVKYLGLGLELFNSAGNYQTTGMQKVGHIKPGNSGGSIVCVNGSHRISVSAVISYGIPLYKKMLGLSLINPKVQDWINQNL